MLLERFDKTAPRLQREIVSRLVEDMAVAQQENAMLRDKIRGDFWLWQGNGEDHLESLVCPVLIRPETLLKLTGYIVCAFCGTEYTKGGFGQETAEKMAAHMAECEKHPMRAAVIENMRLKAALERMWLWQGEVQEMVPDGLGDEVTELLGIKQA